MKTGIIIRPFAGLKDILIEQQPDGSRIASCWCSALFQLVQVPLTAEQADEILSEDRRSIDAILPDTPPPMREIFITGLTPAEFDWAMWRRLRPEEDYEKLGYGGRP